MGVSSGGMSLLGVGGGFYFWMMSQPMWLRGKAHLDTGKNPQSKTVWGETELLECITNWASPARLWVLCIKNITLDFAYLAVAPVPGIHLLNWVSWWVYWTSYICTRSTLCWLSSLSNNNNNNSSRYPKSRDTMESSSSLLQTLALAHLCFFKTQQNQSAVYAGTQPSRP